jgi:hypothetical protein
MPTGQDQAQLASVALAPFADGLSADGYLLKVDAVSNRIMTVRIEAAPEACADCLVPKSVMKAMLKDIVSETLEVDDVEVSYPADL